jgi:hypothetical protein
LKDGSSRRSKGRSPRRVSAHHAARCRSWRLPWRAHARRNSVGAAVVAGLDLDHALGLRVVRRRQIGRTSQQLRNGGSEMVEHRAAGGARGYFLAAGYEPGAGRRDGLLPIGRQLAVIAALEFGTQSGRRRLDAVRPGHAVALRADLAPLAQQRLGITNGRESHPRILRAPAISSSPGASLCAFSVPALVGIPKPMIVLQAIKDGLSVMSRAAVMGVTDCIRVVPVDLLDVPVGGAEALDLGIGNRKPNRAVDRDRVVVLERDQVAELVVACHRHRFFANALHQAAVADEDIGPVLAKVVTELGVQNALGEGEPDRVRNALAERTGCGFDAVGVLVFGMAGGLAVDLTGRRCRRVADTRSFVFAKQAEMRGLVCSAREIIVRQRPNWRMD